MAKRKHPPSKVLICQTCGTPWDSYATFCLNCGGVDLVGSTRTNLSKIGVPRKRGHLGRRDRTTGRPKLLTDRQIVAMDVKRLVEDLSIPLEPVSPRQQPEKQFDSTRTTATVWITVGLLLATVALIILILPTLTHAAGWG